MSPGESGSCREWANCLRCRDNSTKNIYEFNCFPCGTDAKRCDGGIVGAVPISSCMTTGCVRPFVF